MQKPTNLPNPDTSGPRRDISVDEFLALADEIARRQQTRRLARLSAAGRYRNWGQK